MADDAWPEVRIPAEMLDPLERLALKYAHGVFVLRVAFSGDGRVREASAQRSELEPAQERCVLDAVRGLRLPAFSQDQFALTYPFRY